MGFVLSVLYLGIDYMSAGYVLGPLTAYHVQLILVVLAMLSSIPALIKSSILKTPQSFALIGLTGAVFFSRYLENHYLTGALFALEAFIPSALAYFLIYLHCTTKRRLQVIVVMMFSVCLLIIVHGFSDLIHDVANSGPPPGVGLGAPTEGGATASPYLMRQSNGEGGWNYRLQGLGEINDPNDFGQLQVCLLPLLFFFWRPKKTMRNVVFVILPSCVLLFGLFLTHSRGALLALMALLIVAGRRRVGTIPSVALASCLFLGAMALQFTGGRQISASAGEDRTALWGEAIAIFKAHPLSGVGYGNLDEFTVSHLTAHNSIIVCAAETGLIGFYFWSLFLYPTIRNAYSIASPERITESGASPPDEGPFPRAPRKLEELNKDEVNRLGRLAFLSLIGFLVAGWFLSRSFVVTLFLLGGIVESIYQMALQREMISPRLPFMKVLRSSAGLAFCLMTALYIVIRILNMSR